MYAFANLMVKARAGEVMLNHTIFGEYEHQRLDVRGNNDGQGMKLDSILAAFMENNALSEFESELLGLIKEIEDEKEGNSLFLQTFNSFKQDTSCVYAVTKDTELKRITIAFRGSVVEKDWIQNLQAFMHDMKTPALVSKKLEPKYQEHISVHEGFYDYLFDNDDVIEEKGQRQRIDEILDDVRDVVEEGYTIHVAGHSLGGALATILGFHLAGSEGLPKPISLVTFESPMVASKGFKAAFHQMEQDGLIRYLRITNNEDCVPTLPPVSLRFKGLFKHVGVHLDLFSDEFIMDYAYPTNTWGQMWRNSIFKPVLKCVEYHSMKLFFDRLKMHRKTFQTKTFEDLYEITAEKSKATTKRTEL